MKEKLASYLKSFDVGECHHFFAINIEPRINKHIMNQSACKNCTMDAANRAICNYTKTPLLMAPSVWERHRDTTDVKKIQT